MLAFCAPAVRRMTPLLVDGVATHVLTRSSTSKLNHTYCLLYGSVAVPAAVPERSLVVLLHPAVPQLSPVVATFHVASFSFQSRNTRYTSTSWLPVPPAVNTYTSSLASLICAVLGIPDVLNCTMLIALLSLTSTMLV